jgi:phosphoribosylformylglycinamidine synthase
MRLFGDDVALPVISGNVSLYNQSGAGEPIAPTPVVACAGRLDDASRARGFALKQVGSRLVLLGRLHEDLGGSEYERLFGVESAHAQAPKPDFAFECALVKALVDAFARRLVLAAHDISLGGLLVTVAEMVIASQPFDVGAALALGRVSQAATCFSEMGGVVIEASEASWTELQALLKQHGVGWLEIGRTQADRRLDVELEGGSFGVEADELRAVHRGRLAEILYG